MRLINLDIDVLHILSKVVTHPYRGKDRRFFLFPLGLQLPFFPYNTIAIDMGILDVTDDPEQSILSANVEFVVLNGQPALILTGGKARGNGIFFSGLYDNYDHTTAYLQTQTQLQLQDKAHITKVVPLAAGVRLSSLTGSAPGVPLLNGVYTVPLSGAYTWIGGSQSFSFRTGKPVLRVEENILNYHTLFSNN